MKQTMTDVSEKCRLKTNRTKHGTEAATSPDEAPVTITAGEVLLLLASRVCVCEGVCVEVGVGCVVVLVYMMCVVTEIVI